MWSELVLLEDIGNEVKEPRSQLQTMDHQDVLQANHAVISGMRYIYDNRISFIKLFSRSLSAFSITSLATQQQNAVTSLGASNPSIIATMPHSTLQISSQEPEPKMSGSASRKDTLRSKTLQGGYMISMEVALEWANHLRKEIGKPELSGNIRSQGPIMLTLDEKVKEVGGVECNLHGGLRKGEGFRHCFIVTQYGEGLLKRSIKRDCDIDPSQYLERGEIEEVMEEVLREAGIEHSGFTTILYR